MKQNPKNLERASAILRRHRSATWGRADGIMVGESAGEDLALARAWQLSRQRPREQRGLVGEA